MSIQAGDFRAFIEGLYLQAGDFRAFIEGLYLQAGDFCAFIKWLYLLERDSPYSERKRRLTKAYRCFGTKSPLPLMSLISSWKYHKRVLKLYPERVIQWEAMKKVLGE